MLCGVGKLNFARLSYKPVPGEQKSGMPAEVETPAPVMTITLLPMMQ